MNNRVKVKQQTECGSKNWGVYVDGKLVEGGFFTKGAAIACANNWRREIDSTNENLTSGNRV